MAEGIARGQIWQFTFSRPDKRRPVLVLTRSDVIELLHTVMVAPITSTIRGAPSEVVVGLEEGLKKDSAVNLDHIQTVEKASLTRFVGTIGSQKMREVCRALAVATGCDPTASSDLPLKSRQPA
jgi:mRNA interferase MazF